MFKVSFISYMCKNELPLPAENVSTVKLAGAPTTGPTGSIPGP